MVSQEILRKYANVLVNFGLNGGEGVKKGETIAIMVHDSAQDLLIEIYRAALKAGAFPIIVHQHLIYPEEFAPHLFELASEEQLNFYPEIYSNGLIEQADHLLRVRLNLDPHMLDDVPAKKIIQHRESLKPFYESFLGKEEQGKLTWTLASYPTKQLAEEAGMSVEEYWEQIIEACYLREDDPVKKWKQIQAEVHRIRDTLTNLKIDELHIKAPDTDLIVGLGPDRKWLGGTGANVPSFEVYVSPDWRRTQGKIQFTEPLYYVGKVIKGIYLEFENGEVTKATAQEGEDTLKEMIAAKNGNKIGEFSLTDGRMSKITRFMADTLYDENVGGPQGNTHLALGRAYKNSHNGDLAKVSAEEWAEMGYNESSIHVDIVSTSQRTVTATLQDGSKKIIYQDGKFLI